MQAHTQDVHTIFGAGQVGTLLAHELLDRGYSVRLVRRGPAGPSRPGLRWMSGDVTDPAFADEAARGAAVVYNCVNPPDYGRWEGVIEPLMRGVRGAATRNGARLVALDCLYMYGMPEAVPFDEDTPMRPCSRKGELRAMLVEEMFEAHRRGEVEVSTGRASDYFGPGTPLSMILYPRALLACARASRSSCSAIPTSDTRTASRPTSRGGSRCSGLGPRLSGGRFICRPRGRGPHGS